MKNYSTISIVAIVIVIIAGLGWFGSTRVDKNPATVLKTPRGNSALTVPEKLYDFGTISMSEGNVSYTFKVANETDKNVFVKTVNTSCMCTEAYIESESGEKGPFKMPGMGFVPPADETIKAGETRDIKVVFDPAAHGPAGVGAISREIYLIDDDGRTLTLNIKARVTP